MIELYENSKALIAHISHNLKRSLFDEINWQARLIEINGARGTGKTTLMLQKAKSLLEKDQKSCLYVSLDDPFFYRNSLVEVADEFFKLGGEFLFLDEVHRYPSKYPDYDWSSELKTIYDRYPQLKVCYSGSSLLKLYKAKGDLSRRKITYNLPGLSFREYLYFNQINQFKIKSLDELIDHHSEIASEITMRLKIIPHFRTYLQVGYYPFYSEAPDHYFERLKEIMAVILENDIPSVTDIPFETVMKIKKLLGVIAASVPFTPNLSSMRENLYVTDQRTLLRYFYFLEKAELIYNLSKDARGSQVLRKPGKVLLDNPNLQFCFHSSPNTGTLRETFFANQIRKNHEITYPDKGDFMIDGKQIFEIGGKNKTRKQIENIAESYLALDDIETGYDKTIPLWLFGFLY